jgi:formate dehydrogenase major subunit
MIMHQFAEKLGFANELSKNYKMQKVKGMDEPVVEDILREINRSVWTIGYTGQSPERLKAHMKNMHVFDVKTLKAKGGKDKETGYDFAGDYFGLPWPCYGTPELKHPGTANLYDTSKHVMDGGGNFRANFGVEKDGMNLLAEDGSHSLGADITTGYPEFDHVLLKKLGWWDELTDAEKTAAEGKNWKTDSSGGIIRVVMKNHGCHPFGNAKARAVVWNFPDAIPQHREPIYGTRPDLVAKYPTHDDKKAFWRLPTLYKSLQDKNVADKVYEKFPLILTSGRSGRVRRWRRGNPLQPLAGRVAAGSVRGNQPQDGCRPRHSQRRARVAELSHGRPPECAGAGHRTVAPGHGLDAFPLLWPLAGCRHAGALPEGGAPIVRGEAVNTATTYGYDSVTMMQETKTTICNVERA